MTLGAEYADRVSRLHPELVYQVEPSDQALSVERAAVIERLGAPKRVLEIGAANGLFSALLMDRGHEVLAVEGDPRSVALARERSVQVVEGDIESTATWKWIDGRFDAVLFMHVLEHLADPWAALARARERIKAGGIVISLLPNIAAWRVRKDLFFHGRFDYAETGILDRTHLRFFTLGGGLELHTAAGFRNVRQVPVAVCTPFERRFRVQLGAPWIAARWESWALGHFPNLCTEIALFEATA
jgi:SAM-dependent methyltransferase